MTYVTESGSVRPTTSAVTGADASNGRGSGGHTNIGAIVGGVVGGVVGLAALLALLWFFCFRRRNRSEQAFDEKTFDPGNRHSLADPIDLLAPAVPNVGNPDAGMDSHVDPFPSHYGNVSPQQAYDPYSHAPMQMPDAHNYLGGSGYGTGYGNGDGGYGVAAAMGGAALGGAAAGAGAGAYSASQYSSEPSHYGGGPTSPSQSQPHHFGGAVPALAPMVAPGVAAKQREAQAERDRLRSGGSGAGYNSSGPSRDATGSDNRRTSQMSDGGGQSVYQHTDMGSAPDEEEQPRQEIPPGYHSIRQ